MSRFSSPVSSLPLSLFGPALACRCGRAYRAAFLVARGGLSPALVVWGLSCAALLRGSVVAVVSASRSAR